MINFSAKPSIFETAKLFKHESSYAQMPKNAKLAALIDLGARDTLGVYQAPEREACWVIDDETETVYYFTSLGEMKQVFEIE